MNEATRFFLENLWMSANVGFEGRGSLYENEGRSVKAKRKPHT